jgi:hypothetical protein
VLTFNRKTEEVKIEYKLVHEMWNGYI